ncbi:MAG TPA: phosphohydrolase [Coxiellaceae bacterium]|nr:phosphohydrolase [Coxiellaceae bacterium]
MLTKKQTKIILSIKKYARAKFCEDTTGHDWWHTFRVWKLASYLAKKEKKIDLFVVQLASLLHDLEDWKLDHGIKIKPLLKKLNTEPKTIEQVCAIIANVSFKGAKIKKSILSLEGKIVQDADRLDAIGAIGISRAFAYGGSKNRPIYNPKQRPILHTTFKKYQNSKSCAINHFYEKLLLLKKQLNTKTAKIIAKQRHEFMKVFLKHFFAEWNISNLEQK